MLSSQDIMQLVQSLIWLLAGIGVFIVGMGFMGEALEKSAGEGMKRLLGKISNNRFSGVGIGASANITGIGILRREGYTVKNSDFFKIGIPFTMAAIIPAYVYLWFMYGM